jgi:hypothetical protein
MKKFCSLFFLLLTIHSFVSAQQQGIRILEQSTMDYVGESKLVGNQVYILSNGTPFTSTTPVLIRMDTTNYNLNLVKKISGPDSDELVGINIDSTGNILMAGTTDGFGPSTINTYIVKTDNNGNLLSAKTISGTFNSSIKSMTELNTGNLMLLGTLPTVSSSIYDLLLLHCDINGDTLWTKTISTGTSMNAHEVIQLPNGNILILASIFNSTFNTNDIFLTCLDINGNLIWDKRVGSNVNELPQDIFIGPDQKIYVGGSYTGGQSFIYRLDQNGNSDYLKSVSGMTFISAGTSFMSDRIVFGGYGYSANAGDNIARTLMMDTLGNLTWAKQYGGYTQSVIRNVHASGNNRLIMTGEFNDGAINSPNVMLVTTDASGATLTCYEESFAVNIQNISITESSPVVTISSAGSYLTVTSVLPSITISPVNMNQLQNMTLSFSSISNLCDGICNGSLTVTPQNGVAPYAVIWSTFSNATTITNLCSNSYGVNVTDAGGCSVNDTIVLGTSAPVQEICMVTVDSLLDKNLIVWEKDMLGYIAGYNVYRNAVGIDVLIGYVPYDSLSEFVDTASAINPNVTSYRYRMAAVDTCGNESDMSFVHKTIHLTTNLGAGTTINLVWDTYQGFTVSYYRIWRFSLGNGWELKDSVNSSNFTWTDLTPPVGFLKYMIEVISPDECSSTRAANHNSTRSNRGSIMSPNGIGEMISGTLEVFPNPATDQFTILIPEIMDGEIEIEIRDVSGRIVKNEFIQSSGGSNYSVESNFESGVYFVVVRCGNYSYKNKIIIN